MRFSPSSTQFSLFSGSTFVPVSSKRFRLVSSILSRTAGALRFRGEVRVHANFEGTAFPHRPVLPARVFYKIIFRPKMSRTDLGCIRDPKIFSFLSSDGVKPLFTATDMIRKLEERDFTAILLATAFLGALGNTAVRGHFLSPW